MSIKKVGIMEKLRALPSEVELTQSAGKAGNASTDSRAKTAPGAFGDWMARESTVIAENKELYQKLAAWDGASVTRHIDPTLIVRSKWSNRHEDSFSDTEFKELLAEIESAGGNIQPIKVRPLAGEGGKFEVVFGHRRHQACLELGLPVLAMIEDVNEQELFIEMDRENRQRKDLRPYEQGLMYAKALDAGLFPSAKKMAAGIGVDPTNLGRSLSLARLPKVVLDAFLSPLDIQMGWATELNAALQSNPDIVLSRAKELHKEPRPTAKKVLEYLTKGGVVSHYPPSESKVKLKGKDGETGSINLDQVKKTFAVSLKNIEPKLALEIQKFIESRIGQAI